MSSDSKAEDKRIYLPDGFELKITEKDTDGGSSNAYRLTIKKKLSSGGSCLVYLGSQSKSVGDERATYDVIVKELYPKKLEERIKRTKETSYKFSFDDEEAKKQYEHALSLFCRGQVNHIVFASNNSENALPPPLCSGFSDETGAFYSVSLVASGKVLSELDLKEYSITDALELCSSICEAIGKVHEGGKTNGYPCSCGLYLDLKPENVFVLNNRAYLFDFDTVQPRGGIMYSSYSEGWSAPEQELVSGKGCKDVSKIGYHTDIFSIGAVLFKLLTGKNPYEVGLNAIKDGFDWKSNIVLKDTTKALEDDEFIDELNRLMTAMLEEDADKRKDSFARSNASMPIIPLKNEFIHLINQAKHSTSKKEHAAISDGIQSISENQNKEVGMIDDAKEEIKKSIEENSVKKSLFGSKKSILITVIVLVSVTVVIGVVVAITAKTIDAVIPTQATTGNVSTETDSVTTVSDKYILLKLANANHQYEVGIENWKRLDYIRAERDFLAVRKEKSSESSQSDVEVAKINNSLGCLYLDMGRYNEAYDYLNSAFVTFRDHYGENSLEARAVRASIAQYYYFIGKSDEALRETQYILDKSDVKNEKVVIASTKHLRAMIFDAQGHYDDALSLYNEVLNMYSNISANGVLREQLANYANDPNLNQDQKDYYTNSIRWIILTYNNISNVNIHKGDYQEAIKAANTGIEMSLSNVYIGKRNITTSKLYMNIAIAEGKCGDANKALEDIDLAMRIQRNLFDFKDIYPGLVTVYDVYGDLLLVSNRNEEAKEYYLNAVTLAENSFGENHPITAEAYFSLGKYYSDIDLNKSIENLKKAIEIRKNILSENHPDTAKMYFELAVSQRKNGNEEGAKVSLNKAKDICDKWEVKGDLRDKINEALG